MTITGAWRDRFPKTKLDAGYIGDKHMLCSDLIGGGARPFLARGAVFRYFGECSAGGCGYDTRAHVFQPFMPAEASGLYQRLCQPDQADGMCTFPNEVVLNATLDCTGAECGLDQVQGIKIVRTVAGAGGPMVS